jgi:hypothetical protein
MSVSSCFFAVKVYLYSSAVDLDVIIGARTTLTASITRFLAAPLQVLKQPLDSPHIYQAALLPSELKEVMVML